MTLKTLKDMQVVHIELGNYFTKLLKKTCDLPEDVELKFNDKNKLFSIEELKQSAIEWIRSNKSNFYSKQGMEETKLWIRHFFNITDEDLK